VDVCRLSRAGGHVLPDGSAGICTNGFADRKREPCGDSPIRLPITTGLRIRLPSDNRIARLLPTYHGLLPSTGDAILNENTEPVQENCRRMAFQGRTDHFSYADWNVTARHAGRGDQQPGADESPPAEARRPCSVLHTGRRGDRGRDARRGGAAADTMSDDPKAVS